MTGIDRNGEAEKREKRGEKRLGEAGFLYEPSHQPGRPTQHTLISPDLTTEKRTENRKKSSGSFRGKQPCVGRNARGEGTIGCGRQAHARC